MKRAARTPPDILIIGRGAVATMLGARLGQIGLRVSLASRYARRAEVTLRLTDPAFHSSSSTPAFSIPLTEVDPSRFAYILLCCKRYQLETVRDTIHLGSVACPVLGIQNGLLDSFAVGIPALTPCVLESACRLVSPFFAVQAISLTLHAPLTTGATAHRPDRPLRHLAQAGLVVKRHREILRIQLEKLLLASTSALMAIQDRSIEETFQACPLHPSLIALLQEDVAILSRVAHARGLAPPHQFLATYRKILAHTFLSQQYVGLPSFTSVYQDLDRRSGQSEVIYLNGLLCELAESVGLAAPANAALVGAIQRAERTRQTPSQIISEASKRSTLNLRSQSS